MLNLFCGNVIIVSIKLIILENVYEFVLRLDPVDLFRSFRLLDYLGLFHNLFSFRLLGILGFRLGIRLNSDSHLGPV